MRESSGCDVAGSSLSVVLRHLEEEEGVEEGGHGKGRGMQERNAKKRSRIHDCGPSSPLLRVENDTADERANRAGYNHSWQFITCVF